ncbi:MAG TPA: sensor histidine kinase, partial [Gaiellales bacterium]|nr:sensor histidine kinase [Gaiellales bacterium]
EIHHRVKNNLQTVAALLRLQARRLDSPEARLALAESVRRVSSIAIVHETLALTLDEAVPFDAIADRLLAMVGEVGAGESRAELARVGSFGVLPAAVATPLAMVVNELLHNAAEHAFRASRPGHIEVRTERVGSRLRLAVLDDGRGLPEGFQLDASNRLGLQIVRTLVEGELGGVLRLEARPEGGTQATVDVPLPPPVSPAPGTAADQR